MPNDLVDEVEERLQLIDSLNPNIVEPFQDCFHFDDLLFLCSELRDTSNNLYRLANLRTVFSEKEMGQITF